MVCTEMETWWEYDQNFQGLFNYIPMRPKKNWKEKGAFGSKTLKIWFSYHKKVQ